MSLFFKTIAGSQVPPVAPAGKARLFYEAATDILKLSQNGAPYRALGTAQITVTDGPALTALVLTGDMTLGTEAYMTALRCPWTLSDATTQPAPDLITVVASTNPAFVWVRSTVADSSWLQQTTVYRKTAAPGSDFNDGLTPGTAIRTMAEWFRRVGLGPCQATTFFNLDSPLTSDPVPTYLNLYGDNQITIESVPTVVGTGALTGLVKLQRTTGIECSITYPTAVADITRRRYLRLTSGLEIGKSAALMSDAGGGRVNLASFLFVDPLTFTILVANPANLSATDTYEIIENESVFPFSSIAGAVTVSNGMFNGGCNVFSPFCILSQCSAMSGNLTAVLGTCLGFNTNFTSFSVNGGNLGLYGGTVHGSCTTAENTILTLDADMQTAATFYLSGSTYVSLFGMFGVATGAGAFNIEAAGKLYYITGFFGATEFYGAGNAGPAVTAIYDASIQLVKLPTMSGSTDIALQGQTSAYAWDPAAGYIFPARALTWVSLGQSLGAGGFNKNAFYPASNIRVYLD